MDDLFSTIMAQEDLPSENTEADEKTKEISELSKKGYQLLKDNKISEAKDSFSQILALDDNNNYALVGLGDSERKQNHFRDAIEYYSKCLSFHPGNNYALFGLADCYKALNQFHKAIEIWEQYLVHDDRNITVLTRVADAYRKIRDFKKSKELYLRVLDMEENNAYALIGLGHLHYDFKEYRDALYYWTRMLDLNDSDIDIRVLTSIGNCHRKLKTFDKGVIYFERALEMDQNNFYALFGLADCYGGMNQQFRSIEYWNKILKIDPRNKVILTRAGDAYRNTGDYDTATEYYEKALNIEFDIYAVLGLTLISKGQGRYEEAIESLTRLMQADPKNYRLYIDLADCYMKLNQKNKAIDILHEFQKTGIRSQAVNELLEKIQKRPKLGLKSNDLLTLLPLSGFLPEEIHDLIPEEPFYRAKQIFKWISEGAVSFSQMSNIPSSLRDELSQKFTVRGSIIEQKLTDPDGTIKLQLRLHDEFCIETVLLIDSKKRKTACVSCQVGCAMSCAFCKTGTLGFARNLSAHEIVEQFHFLEQEAGKLDNIVFMGMGEPLHNLDAIRKSISVLTNSGGRNLSSRRITLSTAGIIKGIYDLADNGPPIRLAVSLTSADPALREKLMPVTKSNPLNDLKGAIAYFIEKTGKRCTLEAALLGGVNTSNDQADLLASFAKGLDTHINVIPWNPIDELPFTEPSRNECFRFIKKVEEQGINVTMRMKRGEKIGGACGQLGKIEVEKKL